jgi:23S rRNA (uracil1939-C5)-methyltransferase
MTLTVDLHALAYGGASIGTVTAGDDNLIGKKALVRNAIPGETVTVRILEDQKKLIHADLLSVLSPSPDRRDPPCEHFGVCGGCDLQHISIERQRALKREMVESTLARQAQISCNVKLYDGELPEFSYRNRITLHVSETGEVGYYKPGSGDVVPITSCMLARPLIREAHARILDFCRSRGAIIAGIVLEEYLGNVSALVRLRDTCAGFSDEEYQVLESILPLVTVSSRRATVYQSTQSKLSSSSVGHFSQVNPDGNKALQAIVKSYYTGREKITEFYGGSGNFTFMLAHHGCDVVSIEVDENLVRFGTTQAKQQQLDKRVTFIHSSTERYIKQHKISGHVLLDPPRAGAQELMKKLDPRYVSHVVYVSCNLATLARDLSIAQLAGYTIKEVICVDMFPQTHHVETITVLHSNGITHL